MNSNTQMDLEKSKITFSFKQITVLKRDAAGASDELQTYKNKKADRFEYSCEGEFSWIIGLKGLE